MGLFAPGHPLRAMGPGEERVESLNGYQYMIWSYRSGSWTGYRIEPSVGVTLNASSREELIRKLMEMVFQT